MFNFSIYYMYHTSYFNITKIDYLQNRNGLVLFLFLKR